MKLEPGIAAPAFELFDTEKKRVSLESYKGRKLVMLFFPLAFTGTCTKELCSVRDNLSFYNNSDAEVVGISVDSLYTLAKFKEEQALNFTLLSDFNKEVSAAYDTLYPLFGFDMRGVSKRSAFVIDREGVIRYSEVLEDASQVPDFARISETLSSIA
jgi:peroxiredoxin